MPAGGSGAAQLYQQADATQRAVLAAAVELAAEKRCPLFLVGGGVRDLLLTGKLQELDLVVEGDGLRFGEALAARLDARARSHHRFLTMELHAANLRVDVTTARRELYPEPAALPVVEPGTLEEDLARRDFSVNAMAWRLWPEHSPEVLDPFEGQLDLERRQLRVLHERSFQDDPTRLLRGARLAARLGLDFAVATRELAEAAVAGGAFEPLSATRLRRELMLLLEEESSVDGALKLLTELDFWRALHHELVPTVETIAGLACVTRGRREWRSAGHDEETLEWWLVRLLRLLHDAPPRVRGAVLSRLGIRGDRHTDLQELPERLAAVARQLQGAETSAHEIAKLCRGLTAEALVLLWLSPQTRVSQAVERWLDELRHVRLSIGGRDLVARGFAPGPEIGEALRETLEARLDGLIAEPDELAFALRCLAAATSEGRE